MSVVTGRPVRMRIISKSSLACAVAWAVGKTGGIMTAYLYDRYHKLIEVINNCTVITPRYVEYQKFNQTIRREADEGHFFSKTQF